MRILLLLYTRKKKSFASCQTKISVFLSHVCVSNLVFGGSGLFPIFRGVARCFWCTTLFLLHLVYLSAGALDFDFSFAFSLARLAVSQNGQHFLPGVELGSSFYFSEYLFAY